MRWQTRSCARWSSASTASCQGSPAPWIGSAAPCACWSRIHLVPAGHKVHLYGPLRHPADKDASNAKLGDILGRLVRQAQEQGEIRADLDPGEIAQAIVGAYLAGLFEWIAESEDHSPAPTAMVENVMVMLFERIAGTRYRGKRERRQAMLKTLGKRGDRHTIALKR